MPIKIAYLKDHPEEIPTLARVWHNLLGGIWVPDIPIEHIEQRFQGHLNDKLLPLTFLAFDGNQLVGSISLRESDWVRPDLMPWLGSLVVDTPYQRCGIGTILIETAKQKAAELGFDHLHLFAVDPTLPPYYIRHGFNKIGMGEFKGRAITIMKTILINDKSS